MLSLRNVSWSIGGRLVLDALELDVPEASWIGIHGASGAGKTSLLRLIAGLERDHLGSITWEDRALSGGSAWVPPWLRPFAMVFQDFALWPHLTAAQHLDFVMTRKAGPFKIGRSPRERAAHWLSRLGLADFAQRYPAELSGGQQQRLALARSLATEPRLLLLDEPVSVLDDETAASVREVLRDWRSMSGCAAIVVTHDLTWLDPLETIRYELLAGRLQPISFGRALA
ncbi:MAG: ABC transporter ATP-binding protein [Panacagrimonas sp.]